MTVYSAPGIPDIQDVMINEVIDHVCNNFDLPKEIIMSKSRKEKIRVPRQIIHYICSVDMGISLMDLSRFFKMDHTTIMNSRDKIRSYMETYEDMKKQIEEIEKGLEVI